MSDGSWASSSEKGRAAPRAVIAHHSPDLYGSDLQMLETVTALVEDDWDVTVVLPYSGPLVPRLQERGARVELLAFPTLQKSILSVPGLAQHAIRTLGALIRIRSFLNHTRPNLVIVNTIVIPVWLLAARLGRERHRSVCHVHEAEAALPRAAQFVLTVPLLLARGVLANSKVTLDTLTSSVPLLRARIKVLHNGVARPKTPPVPVRAHLAGDDLRVVVVGRLSPRKGTDTALEAIALLRERGLPTHLTLCGSVFAGYEWFEEELRSRAELPDLQGSVTFAGYVEDVWPHLAAADVALVPSLGESFGNVAVEAMHARRPLVTSDVQGLAEIVKHNETGLLAQPGDPIAMADAIERLAASPDLAASIAESAQADAAERFSVEVYHTRMARLLRPFHRNR